MEISAKVKENNVINSQLTKFKTDIQKFKNLIDEQMVITEKQREKLIQAKEEEAYL